MGGVSHKKIHLITFNLSISHRKSIKPVIFWVNSINFRVFFPQNLTILS